LEAAEADLDRVDIHTDERPFMLPGDIQRLEHSIREHKAKLVVLDPSLVISPRAFIRTRKSAKR
jgi:hypothetical protein